MPTRFTLLIFAGLSLPCLGADRPARYVAAFADGQRLEGNRLRDWHDERATPSLDGNLLFSPGRSLRWLRDRWQPQPEVPTAYVEFTNGDRLPGEVIDFRTGQEDAYAPLPAHLVVRVALKFEPPENKPVAEIRVATAFVRRVVWQGRADRSYQAGTAFYRDGRSMMFRSLRWHSGLVHLLAAEGDQRAMWSELAEVHLAAGDPWEAYFDQVGLLCQDATTRLVEMETSSGLVALASTARFAARFEGNSADPERWVHGIQPAWSLDILWIPFREIACYRFFLSHEVPLSRIAPRANAESGRETRQTGWQLNRNASGGWLRNKSKEFGWGFGVRGMAECAFELPSYARTFRTSVCLDREAGDGGCVRPRLFIRPVGSLAGGELLWEGPLLIGSEMSAETGPLKLPPLLASTHELVLQADSVKHDRPPNADPFEIRDFTDWCDALVVLDEKQVKRELAARLAAHFPAWRNWDLSDGNGNAPSSGWQISYHRTQDIPGRFEPAIASTGGNILLTTERVLSPHDRWLVIAASLQPGEPARAPLEVQMDDREPIRLIVRPRKSGAEYSQPLVVRLPEHQEALRKNTRLAIRQMETPAQAALAYDFIAILEQLPNRYDLLQSARPSAGERHVFLKPEQQLRVKLADVVKVRSSPKMGEARFLRLAIFKRGGGRVAIEFEEEQAREQPVRYDLGQGAASFGSATRIWDAALPEDEVIITRDLFADFGNMDVTGVTFSTLDGGDVTFQEAVLAPTRQDLDEPVIQPKPLAR